MDICLFSKMCVISFGSTGISDLILYAYRKADYAWI